MSKKRHAALMASMCERRSPDKLQQDHRLTPFAQIKAKAEELSRRRLLEGQEGSLLEIVERLSRSEWYEYQLTLGSATLQIASKEGETRIIGDVDPNVLREVLETHLERLVGGSAETRPR
ncbi:hypothetical protein [Caballeronia sp. ATUFL_M2_KS44]|uniref:hypothetical protein n=1 Tax=Caballeronia sp. ATUFL_M2_KS44 TaxID=2921767 RepID=UPI002027EEF1|nr:hypothetical protein [Caballeronia sp. ATUFL_M2_KS44]